jgi:hypothetical protein
MKGIRRFMQEEEGEAIMESFLKILIDKLTEATCDIKEEYFRLPVASDDGPVIMTRERVYSYELYHQLRLRLPRNESFPYVLHGEVDKSRHPFIKKLIGRKIPDFIIHIPGSYDSRSNLAVIEVKACGAHEKQVHKDLETLSMFIEKAHYFAGINLIYGKDEEELIKHLRTGFGEYRRYKGQLYVYWHPNPEEPAQSYPWWDKV